ncbi:hypothetical protein FGO68_gene9228 [Halteria grandinella]|uniref:Uncharacterized protein n=1 Tax=Halteria grandinella TaxID=5974 RepID=A0A8J8NFR6_HALGN|nr:hypothetical protein FGO68_gene9228 [Halteria grandinella]
MSVRIYSGLRGRSCQQRQDSSQILRFYGNPLISKRWNRIGQMLKGLRIGFASGSYTLRLCSSVVCSIQASYCCIRPGIALETRGKGLWSSSQPSLVSVSYTLLVLEQYSALGDLICSHLSSMGVIGIQKVSIEYQSCKCSHYGIGVSGSLI